MNSRGTIFSVQFRRLLCYVQDNLAITRRKSFSFLGIPDRKLVNGIEVYRVVMDYGEIYSAI